MILLWTENEPPAAVTAHAHEKRFATAETWWDQLSYTYERHTFLRQRYFWKSLHTYIYADICMYIQKLMKSKTYPWSLPYIYSTYFTLVKQFVCQRTFVWGLWMLSKKNVIWNSTELELFSFQRASFFQFLCWLQFFYTTLLFSFCFL